jgi:hypothetical protein
VEVVGVSKGGVIRNTKLLTTLSYGDLREATSFCYMYYNDYR